MIKFIGPRVCAFDAEWVPCVRTGRRLYGLSAEDYPTDFSVMLDMWQRAGANEDNRRPYLKTAISQIVSLAFIERDGRSQDKEIVKLKLVSAADRDEGALLRRIVAWLDRTCPQLVGFNSKGADLPAILQRAAVYGLSAPQFCAIPEKPWQGRDYFAKFATWHVDLQQVWGGFGKSTASLNEMCAALGIPGKAEVDGGDVATLWLAGDLATILQYNEEDALRTYLVWLRAATLAGLLTHDQRMIEEMRLMTLLVSEIAGQRPYLRSFMLRWDALMREWPQNEHQ